MALAVALAASLAAPSCGGDDPPAGPGPIPLDSFAAEYKDAACDRAVRCGLMPDKDTCLRLDRTDGELLQLLANAVFGDVTYSSEAARACVDALRGRSCEELLSAARSLEATCDGVFDGAAPAGGPCLVGGDCAGNSVCDRTACEGTGDACCKGACAPTPARAPVGATCSQEMPCDDNGWCEEAEGQGGGGGVGPTGTCQPRNDNGESCSDSDACRDGLRCDLSVSEGKCYILAKDGGQCNPTLERACLSFDSWCDPASSKCGKLPGSGQPCTPESRCRAYAYCDNGTCRARPMEGESCLPDGPRCLGDLYCNGDTAVCTAEPTDRVCVDDE